MVLYNYSTCTGLSIDITYDNMQYYILSMHDNITYITVIMNADLE